MINQKLILGLFITIFVSCTNTAPEIVGERWSEEKANTWYEEKGWLIGSNYNSSTAINQLEMWQEDDFNPEVINRELKWAADLGFNSMRVYLHDLVWKEDPDGFLNRIEQYLKIAESHDVGTMFVLFDGVWNPYPELGDQPEPVPHVHNSGWVQSPGADILADTSQWDYLEEYVKGVIGHFSNDDRVDVWDIYNEPDNTNDSSNGEIELKNKKEQSFRLLKESFQWAKEVNPSQPITSGLWYGDWSDHNEMKEMDQFMVENSDVISFHSYEGPEVMNERIKNMQRYNRPVFCTEYMARPRGSTFKAELPMLKKKTQGLTIGDLYPVNHKPSIHGILGIVRTPLSLTYGFMTFCEVIVLLTIRKKWSL